MDTFDITKYIEMALRRKYWIIIPFMLVVLAGLHYTLNAPKIYEATTLILVQAQKVPEAFVEEIVSSDTEDRLRTIEQEVRSRTNLEKIIEEYELYNSPAGQEMLTEEKVNLLNNNISINVAVRSGSGGNAFSISFQGTEPRKVMQVTNALASNFTSVNLQIRESQAMGTLEFLTDELDSVRNKLMEMEEELKSYNERYMGGLPEELDTNLSILERYQGQIEELNSNLRAAEDRKIVIQQGMAAAGQGDQITPGALFPFQTGEEGELEALKSELASLQARYTEKHPEVIDRKNQIAALEEAQIESQETEDTESSREIQESAEITGGDQALRLQLENVNLEISRLKEEIEETKSQIDWYETKVKETPTRVQELTSRTRDYNNLMDLYNSYLTKKSEAEIAVNLEKKQKAEQFRVLDTAQLPSIPIKPDTDKLLLMTIALGLGLGCGLAYFMELIDTSYKDPEDLEKELNLSVLVNIPIIYTAKELTSRKRKNILAAISIAMGFIVCIMVVVMASKGVDTTVDYFMDILGI